MKVLNMANSGNDIPTVLMATPYVWIDPSHLIPRTEEQQARYEDAPACDAAYEDGSAWLAWVKGGVE